MTLYLQLNGTSDYLQTPSVAVNKIVIEMQHDSDQPGTSYLYYMDFRPANSTWLYGHKTGDDQGWVGSVTNLIVDGTTYTNAWNGVGAIPKGIKTNLTLNLSAVLTGAINFFRKNDNTFKLKGRIHRITGYNGATVVFDYNMSTGTVNDQSGNGRHATLSGGTWVDDGVSAGTQHTGSASLLGTGSLSASGTNIPASSASVSLMGSGLFSATGKVEKQSGANLLGTGDLTATGIHIVQAPAAPVSGSFLYITDISGNTEALSGFKGLKRYRSVSGEKTLAFSILPTDKNVHSFNMVQEESIVEFKGESYRIKQINEKNRGQIYYKEVVAIHTFFDLIDDFKYETYTGSMTFQAALQFVFTGTAYTWDIVDTFYAQDFDNFGNDNRLALFQEILKRYGAEFTLNGTHLLFKVKIGNNTDFQFRYNYNVKTITRNVNTNNLSTYGKGFGKKNEDGTYLVHTEYTSPNASIFGVRHAKPIEDERYTTVEGLLAAIKANMKDTPEVSITIDFVDMRRAGFPYDVPNEGDYLFLIFEPMNNLDIEARLMDIEEEFDEFNDYPLRTAVTIANFRNNFTDKFIDFSRTQKQVDSVIAPDGKIRYDALAEQVKRSTAALLSAQTELEFVNGIISRSKTDPNQLTILNSAGFGISKDNGVTFTEAITTEGFNLSVGAVGKLNSKNIQVGGDTTFENGYNPAVIDGKVNRVGTYIDQNGVYTGQVVASQIYAVGDLTNLVYNSDFSLGNAGWGQGNTVVNDAGHWLTVNGKVVSQSTRDGHFGEEFPVYAGEHFHVSCYTFGGWSSKDFKMGIRFLMSDGSYQWINGIYVTPGNGWTFKEGTVAAPVGAKTGRVWFNIGAFDNYGTWLYDRAFVRRQGLVKADRIEAGKLTIIRPDGYISVNDGILRNSVAVQWSEPPFQTLAVEKYGQFYRTNSNARFENIQRGVFKHDSRYLRVVCNLYCDGGLQYGNVSYAAFDVVSDDESVSIASGVISETRHSTNQGYRQDLWIDLGVPTGNLLVVYWRMWSSVSPYHTYGSVRYIAQEG